MFNYNNLNWQVYRTAAQGYRGDSISYMHTMYTSYNYLSYQLPSLLGNRRKDIILCVVMDENLKLSKVVHGDFETYPIVVCTASLLYPNKLGNFLL